MIKTQIQLPDDLYRRAKKFAEDHEWSLAETFRRAAEQMFQRYPGLIDPAWQLPTPRDLGWKGLTAEELHKAALDDLEPGLPPEAR